VDGHPHHGYNTATTAAARGDAAAAAHGRAHHERRFDCASARRRCVARTAATTVGEAAARAARRAATHGRGRWRGTAGVRRGAAVAAAGPAAVPRGPRRGRLWGPPWGRGDHAADGLLAGAPAAAAGVDGAGGAAPASLMPDPPPTSVRGSTRWSWAPYDGCRRGRYRGSGCPPGCSTSASFLWHNNHGATPLPPPDTEGMGGVARGRGSGPHAARRSWCHWSSLSLFWEHPNSPMGKEATLSSCLESKQTRDPGKHRKKGSKDASEKNQIMLSVERTLNLENSGRDKKGESPYG